MSPAEAEGVIVQARRYWYAGRQDQDHVVRFMHLSYAKALLDALIHLIDREDIANIMKRRAQDFPGDYTYDRFYAEVSKLQDDAAMTLIHACDLAFG